MKILIIITLIFILLASSAFTVEGLIDSINQVRADNNLEPVQRFNVLDNMAHRRLNNTLDKIMLHDNFAYDVCRMWQFGLTCISVSTMGEIVAVSNVNSSDNEIVRAWLDSPTHRAVILDPEFIYIGGYTENNIVIINFMGEWK